MIEGGRIDQEDRSLWKLKLKYWRKNNKDEIRNSIIILGLAVVYLIIIHRSGILRNLSDLLFVMGILHILVGGVRYIKNVGLFKTFSYWSYQRRWKRVGPEDGELRPMTLTEYTMNVVWDETRHKSVKKELLIGIVLILLSAGAAVLTYR